MFLTLDITGPDAQEASWVLFKHPKTEVERKLGNRGIIRGKFTRYDEDYVQFSSILIPNGDSFLAFCKEENLTNYLIFADH